MHVWGILALTDNSYMSYSEFMIIIMDFCRNNANEVTSQSNVTRKRHAAVIGAPGRTSLFCANIPTATAMGNLRLAKMYNLDRSLTMTA